MSDLDVLLDPRSVALIGASANPSKLSNIALANLKKGRFKLFPVNPKEKEILGLKCYASVLDIPEGVDIALISLPADGSVEPARQCAKKGVKLVIVTASGFRESGHEGQILENELVSALEGSATRLLGPNTMGIVVPRTALDTFFISADRNERPRDGSTAILSQSGGVLVSSMMKLRVSGLGISACIGLGNKADITENDLILLLRDDPNTKCIAMYLESFSDGKEFVRIAGEVSKSKPIILLKSGRTLAGARAAMSHTGALSVASEAMVDGALAQSGVIRVYDEEDLVDTAKALALARSIDGDRICIVASAGGYGIIASDYVESQEHGVSLRMAELSTVTIERLKPIVPGYASVSNPVDLSASVTDEMYDSVLGILQDDPNVDGIMMSLELQPPNVTNHLVEVARKRSLMGAKPIVIIVFAGDDTDRLVKSLGEQGVPAYPTIWRAVKALAALAKRGTHLKRPE